MNGSVQPLPHHLLRNSRVLPDRTDILRHLPSGIVFVEIGVALGDFTERVLQACDIAHFHAIDIFTLHDYPHTWDGRVGRELGGRTHRAYYEDRFAQTIAAGRMTVMEGSSHQKLEELADGSVDVFYVDADHEYSAVKAELAIIRRKIAPGGIIILNDYTMFDQFRMMPYGVIQAAHEFMIAEQWEMLFLALHHDMFCDIAIRRIPPQDSDLAARVQAAEARAAAAEARARAAEANAAQLQASTSWRITAPLRALRRVLGGGDRD